ncbi:MAG: sugar ABC transporter permease [Acidobacteria bacterium]|nr:MAG: sugar ABC transporter permease [Acidobacteriota bacterium]
MSTPAKFIIQPRGSPPSRRGRLLPWALVAPTVLFVVAMTVFPLGYSMWTSLQEYPLGQPPAFVGLRNYQKLIHDVNFRSSLATTLLFTISATGVEFVLGLGLALLLKGEFSFQGIIRSSLMIPMVIAPVVVGIIWRLLYNADVGLFSFAVQELTGKSLSVLSSSMLALPALILVDVWEWTPFMFLLLLAGIQSLPQEPFEAARVDGASTWDIFRHLTMPMLRPVIVVALLIRSLDAFTVFDQVFVLTQGGPGTATEVATLMIYKSAFRFSQFGYAAAMAISLLILVMFFSAAVTRALRGSG